MVKKISDDYSTPACWILRLALRASLVIYRFISGNREPRERNYCGGRGGVAVSTLDFRSEGRWFDVQSLPLYCFLRQEILSHFVSLHPGPGWRLDSATHRINRYPADKC